MALLKFYAAVPGFTLCIFRFRHRAFHDRLYRFLYAYGYLCKFLPLRQNLRERKVFQTWLCSQTVINGV